MVMVFCVTFFQKKQFLSSHFVFLILIVLAFIFFCLFNKAKAFYQNKLEENDKNKLIFVLAIGALLSSTRFSKLFLNYLGINFNLMGIGYDGYIFSLHLDGVISFLLLITFIFYYKKIMVGFLNLKIVQFLFFFLLRVESGLIKLPVSLQVLIMMLLGFDVGFLSIHFLGDFYFPVCFVALFKGYFDLQKLASIHLEENFLSRPETTSLDILTGEDVFTGLNLATSILLGAPLQKKIGPYLLEKNYAFLIKRHMRRAATKVLGAAAENPETTATVVTLGGAGIYSLLSMFNEKRESDVRVVTEEGKQKIQVAEEEALKAAKVASESITAANQAKKVYYERKTEKLNVSDVAPSPEVPSSGPNSSDYIEEPSGYMEDFWPSPHECNFTEKVQVFVEYFFL